MCEDISSVCRFAYHELLRISATRPFLTKDVTATFVCDRVFISDWLLQIPFDRPHFRADGPTSKSTEQCSSADFSSEAQRACNTIAEVTPLAAHQTSHCIQIGNLCLPLLRRHTSSLRLRLSLLIHSLQMPSIFFWQTTICSTCKFEKVQVLGLSSIRYLLYGTLFRSRFACQPHSHP